MTPYWQSDCGRAIIYTGDCLDVIPHLKEEMFHAIVTDPPYNLSFMGNSWDSHRESFQDWMRVRAEKMLKVVRPGAYILSFGGTRVWHRMCCGIEDAGWEIKDMIFWLYSTGFPKGLDISKAIDKEYGAVREETNVVKRNSALGGILHRDSVGSGGYGFKEVFGKTEPVTEAAKQWKGWNTTLKPAVEPIVMAQKSCKESIALNTLSYGCGGINIDACRIGDGDVRRTSNGGVGHKTNPIYGEFRHKDKVDQFDTTVGRHPTNMIHDGSEEVLGLLGEAARFFYCPKADESDRPHGRNSSVHPTVKPLELMQYLVKLVCVRGGTVLDPFMGSGSTGCAVLKEGMKFVGIELNEDGTNYADIAVGRLKLALESAPEWIDAPIPTREQLRRPDVGTRPTPKKLDWF